MSVASLAMTAAGPDVKPGTVPAWAVVFATKDPVTVSSDTYDGSVSATLPADLTGGKYEVVIEGMTDEDYQRIHRTGDTPLVAAIHLWWQDSPTGVLGDLAQFTGLNHPRGAISPDPPPFSLVAVIRVDRLWRRPGPRRFDVVVNGRELAVALLSDTPATPIPVPNLSAAVRSIALDAGVTVQTYGLDDIQPPPGAKTEAVPIPPGTALFALTSILEHRARPLLGLYGQPLAVIRDNIVHVGVWANETGTRLPVLRGVDDDSGLLAIARGSARQREQQAGVRPDAPRSRLTLQVTTLGRPDLKPGDTLVLELPPEDFPTVEPPSIAATLLTAVPRLPFGDIGPDPDQVSCRITEVSHRISREEGFVTVVQAFILAGGDDGWDLGGSTPVPEVRGAPTIGEPQADPAQAFATRLRDATTSLTADTAGRARSRVGLVHDHPGDSDSGTPKHTSDVWYATLPPDGGIGTAQRVHVEDGHAEAHQVPYATPFAWGNYGLALPRYPGVRVLLVDGAGAPGEYVDVGALWQQGEGPDAKPGDYWLALPVRIPAVNREHLQDPSQQLPNDGPASHDLIDADGVRIIETSQFVLRVTDDLTQVPGRPVPDPDAGAGSVVIETKSTQDGLSARIVLLADGSASITATAITFDTSGFGGDIELRANNVRVRLADGGTMDVS